MTSETSKNPKRSKAKLACLLVLVIGVLAYCAHLAIAYGKFSKHLTQINGVRIGDSREEVKYRLGYPPFVLGALEKDGFEGKSQKVFTVLGKENDVNKMPPTTKVEDYNEWQYEEPNSPVRLTVEFNKSGLVESLELYCDSNVRYGWGAVAGIYCGDSEEEVLHLGAPSHQHLDGVSKTVEYSDLGVEVTLSKGRAYMIKIRGPQNKAAIFSHFMRSYF